MAETQPNRIAVDRLILTVIGALAGAAAYGLIEVLPDYVSNERIMLLLVTATGGFFAAFLAATGPLSFVRAGLAAFFASVPGAVLLYWASFRFSDVDPFLNTGAPLVAFLLILIMTLPFLIALQRAGEGWRNYPALFTQSWNIVVRYAAAWVFVGVFWAVILLSNELFKLVGLDIIERLLDMESAPFVLTGAVLGLAMAVVVELSDYISPFLILRLMRLLVPVVLVVTLVFLVALPLRGLSDLFGGLSAAATLMAMAIGIATLITSSIDKSDDRAATGHIMTIATQVLALAMPLLAGLAIYAIWLRVAEYGLSPSRLAAGLLAFVTLGYGTLYALVVLMRRAWMERVRQANIIMALVSITLSAVWLSPLLNPERISAKDQVARFQDGRTSLDALDLWFIKHNLGVAGKAAIDQLAAMDHPQSTQLNAAIARLETSKNRYAYEGQRTEADLPTLRAELLGKIVIRPAQEALPADVFDTFPAHILRDFIDGCDAKTPAGNAGCIVVLADFIQKTDGQEAVFIYTTNPTHAALQVLWPDAPHKPFFNPVFLDGSRSANINPDAIDDLHAGRFELKPVEIMSLLVGGAQFILKP